MRGQARGCLAALCLGTGLPGCTPHPQGTWSGTFVGVDGSESAVRVTTGERDRRSPYAYERERWRVWEAEGRVEGWYRFDGVLMECVDGPCVVNVHMVDERLVGEHLHKYPEVPHGSVVVLGDPPLEWMQYDCKVWTFGGRSWPVWFVLEGDGERDSLQGEGRMGDGCVHVSGPGEGLAGEVSLWR